MKIEYVKWDSLRPAPWRATHCLKVDLQILADSIIDYGWYAPIIVKKDTGEIIDGFHRWVCAQSDKRILKRDKNLVPVIFEDVDTIDAMLMHIRLNRGRGQLLAQYMSNIVRELFHSRKYSEDQLKEMLSMSYAEITLMMDGSVLKTRKIKEHKYSKAWVPIEAPAGSLDQDESPTIERPPNKDR
jgi:ParB-like chromosome segregation protein Spo0J